MRFGFVEGGLMLALGEGTTYAPLNTPIDGDRNYFDLTGLERITYDQQGNRIGGGCIGLEGCNCGYQGLDGFSEGEGEIDWTWTAIGVLGVAAIWWALRPPTEDEIYEVGY